MEETTTIYDDIQSLQRAVLDQNEKAAVDLALTLLSGFLIDVRRIANALETLSACSDNIEPPAFRVRRDD